jgi:protein PhnA
MLQIHDSRDMVKEGGRRSLFLQLEPTKSDAGYNMSDLPDCPECGSEYTYADGNMYVCPECAHEWSQEAARESDDNKNIIKDIHGNVLQDGDTVTVIKDLKVKGSSSVVKVGTRVRNIRLVEGDHDIDCKIDGIGAMKLKSEFVKKT